MRFLLPFALLPIAVTMIACGAPDAVSEGQGSADLAEKTGKKFDVNHLVEDGDILGGDAITVDQVQSFLDTKGSFLATYNEGGSSAAQIIIDRCKADGVSPVYMLARIQGESSLVGSGSSNNLIHATGCGCPDGKPCSKSKEGFEQQITCAADLIKGYFDDLDAKGETVSGAAVNKPMTTLDPCDVTPDNRATAALYTYTPWVGTYGDGCGSTDSMGSTGIAEILSEYKAAFPAVAATDATPPPATKTPRPPAAFPPSSPSPSAGECPPVEQWFGGWPPLACRTAH